MREINLGILHIATKVVKTFLDFANLAIYLRFFRSHQNVRSVNWEMKDANI